VVDATWERRNLGVACSEVTFDAGDDPAELASVLHTLEPGYHVVKLPVARYDVMRLIEGVGFSFIEALLGVSHDLHLPQPSGLFMRMVDATSCVTVDPSGLEVVAARIRGGLFTTDRVFLDPSFTSAQAADRYVNWMHDEVARGGSVHELQSRGRGVGFFVFRQDDQGVGYSILSGLYDPARSPGLGSVLLRSVLVEAAARGLRALSSHISSNNVPVIKTHVDQGFTITDVRYVYVRTIADIN